MDTVEGYRATLKKVWPDAAIKQDIFHVINRYNDKIPENHAMRCEWQWRPVAGLFLHIGEESLSNLSFQLSCFFAAAFLESISGCILVPYEPDE